MSENKSLKQSGQENRQDTPQSGHSGESAKQAPVFDETKGRSPEPVSDIEQTSQPADAWRPADDVAGQRQDGQTEGVPSTENGIENRAGESNSERDSF